MQFLHDWGPLAAVLAGLLLLGYLVRRRRRLPPARRWAVAASASLSWPRGDRLDQLALGGSPSRAQETLRGWWSIEGPADVEPTLVWLDREGHNAALQQALRATAGLTPAALESRLAAVSEDEGHSLRFACEHRDELANGLLGFDLVRLLFVSRAAFTAGWLAEERAWAYMLPAARRLQGHYRSWAELARSYLLGRRFWGGSPEDEPAFDEAAAWLTTSRESPWRTLDWNLPLSPRP